MALRPRTWNALIALAAAGGLTFLGWWQWNLPLPLAWLAAVNVTVFVLYGVDKRNARRESRRVPEVVLHGAALLGGSPGAYAGMQFFRHKTVKLQFRLVFWVIALLQLALLVWLSGRWLNWWG